MPLFGGRRERRPAARRGRLRRQRHTAARPRPAPTTGDADRDPARPRRRRPSTTSPTASGSRSSSSIPTTATVYGDERYADRLEDPGPAGRARTPGAHGADGREARRDRHRRACRPRTGSPATCSRSSPSSRSRRTTSTSHQLQVVDQMGGPQQLLPQLTQFQPADTPERLEAFLARLARLSGVHGRQHRDPARRPGDRADGAADRRRADDRPARADAGGPDRVGDRAVDGPGRVRGRPRARPRGRPRRRLPGRPGLPRRAARRLPRGDAARSRALVGAERRRPLPDRRSGAGRRSTSTRRRSTRSGLDELETIEAERRGIARAAGLRRRHRRPIARRSTPTIRRTRPQTKDELVARAPRGHRAGDGASRRATSASCRRPAARSGRSRSSRRRTRRSPTTSRRRRTARGPASTTPTATTCRAGSTRSSPRRPTTRRCPGHHFQIALEMENPDLNTFRRLGARIVGGAYVEGWGLYSERLADEMGLFRDEAERFGMLDAQAWRAARLVVDTGLHALRWPRQRSIDFLARRGPVGDRRGHRDRPLHRLAGPGPDLQDRPARDRAAARASSRRATGRRSTCARFHDAVLGHGSLPLATLAASCPNWVATPA